MSEAIHLTGVRVHNLKNIPAAGRYLRNLFGMAGSTTPAGR